MNSKPQTLYSLALALMVSIGLGAQTKSKTYKETFNVGDDAVLEINTSHADVEFETWDKNQVEIIATVTLEGASEEEIERYFKKKPIKMVGNSESIEIRTNSQSSWDFALAGSDFNFHFEDNVMDLEPLFENLYIPELPEIAVLPDLPPMPPIPFKSFDYSAYKEDGDTYLKKWTEEFKEGFDEEYKERYEEWGKRVEEKAKAWEERNAERLERMEKRNEERAEAMEKRREEIEKRREEARERREEARERAREERSIFFSRDDDEPSIFYFSTDGEDKKYKVKKTIKVKMPKSTRLKMNVRHGEVKLAATTTDINASLRYASLLASTIEGRKTDIRASYSPVIVQKWNYGRLKTDYSDRVTLKEVNDLRLNSVSSDVIIDRLIHSARVTSKLGALKIKSVAPGFQDVDINVQNGEVHCKIPQTPFTVYVNETSSNFDYPSKLVLETSDNFNNNIHQGYHLSGDASKSININSKYSQVVLVEKQP
ncbi:MAG: hypothetical protein HRT65_11135 [Flavobacteriaceae bacterium]|nr:hypothetical protein [Flavobacteriaceae bacterium]